MESWKRKLYELIKYFEKFDKKRYWDVNQWSCGYGTNIKYFNRPITDRTVVSVAEAEAAMINYCQKTGLLSRLEKLTNLNDDQKAAYGSLMYNLGVSASKFPNTYKHFEKADLTRNAMQKYIWDNFNKLALPGNVIRYYQTVNYYFDGNWGYKPKNKEEVQKLVNQAITLDPVMVTYEKKKDKKMGLIWGVIAVVLVTLILIYAKRKK